jgi:hypothetical protein
MEHPTSGCIFACNSGIIFIVSGRAAAITSLNLYAPLKWREFSLRTHRNILVTDNLKNGHCSRG